MTYIAYYAMIDTLDTSAFLSENVNVSATNKKGSYACRIGVDISQKSFSLGDFEESFVLIC